MTDELGYKLEPPTDVLREELKALADAAVKDLLGRGLGKVQGVEVAVRMHNGEFVYAWEREQ